MAQEHRPPINLDEVEESGGKERKVERKPGALEYQRGGGASQMRSLNPIVQILVSAILGFTLTVVAGFKYVASSGDVDSLKTQIAAVVTKSQSDALQTASDKARLDNLINNQGNYAKISDLPKAVDLSLYVLKTSLPDISGLATKSSLEDKIAGLQAQIAALKAIPVTSTGVTTGQVKATFSTSNWVPTSYTPTATARSFQLPFKVTITNGLDKQISNIQLFLSMYSSYPGGTATLTALSGGAWTTYTATTNIYYFTNSSGMSSWGGTGLTIPANSSQIITLIFSYTAPAAADGTLINFSPDIAPISASDYTLG